MLIHVVGSMFGDRVNTYIERPHCCSGNAIINYDHARYHGWHRHGHGGHDLNCGDNDHDNSEHCHACGGCHYFRDQVHDSGEHANGKHYCILLIGVACLILASMLMITVAVGMLIIIAIMRMPMVNIIIIAVIMFQIIVSMLIVKVGVLLTRWA